MQLLGRLFLILPLALLLLGYCVATSGYCARTASDFFTHTHGTTPQAAQWSSTVSTLL